MAAERISSAGFNVSICDAMPSFGRKFLMAGKSGLNLTKAEPLEDFLKAYGEDRYPLEAPLRSFGPEEVQAWACEKGQNLFVGTTGRVFPTVMKASPLLRAWLSTLQSRKVKFLPRWRWLGWDEGKLRFSSPEGQLYLHPEVTVLALGGATWSRLGSDAAWARSFAAAGIPVEPFQPSNAALSVDWSDVMCQHFGTALKNICITAGTSTSRGEVIISQKGIEGGGVYPLTPEIRKGASITIDMAPDWTESRLAQILSKRRAKDSTANHLRKAARLTPLQIALVNEWCRPLPTDPARLAQLLKALPVRHSGLRPLDEAISSAGGVSWDALDETLMLKAKPGTYCVGEMLDWEAPTGGYLITAAMATGHWAGEAAVRRLRSAASPMG